MAKVTTSFRLPDKAKEKLDVLARLFKESQADVLVRAIDLLYEDRERIAKLDMDQRLTETKKVNQ